MAWRGCGRRSFETRYPTGRVSELEGSAGRRGVRGRDHREGHEEREGLSGIQGQRFIGKILKKRSSGRTVYRGVDASFRVTLRGKQAVTHERCDEVRKGLAQRRGDAEVGDAIHSSFPAR